MKYRGTDAQALQILIEHELAISALYAAYADRFTDHREFWAKLATEENEHADAIRGLQVSDSEQSLHLNTRGFKPAAVNTSISFLRESTQRARKSPIGLRDALSTALDLEKAMIERKFFDIFDNPNPIVQQVSLLLTNGTQEHVRLIEQEWQKYRSA